MRCARSITRSWGSTGYRCARRRSSSTGSRGASYTYVVPRFGVFAVKCFLRIRLLQSELYGRIVAGATIAAALDYPPARSNNATNVQRFRVLRSETFYPQANGRKADRGRTSEAGDCVHE